MTDRIFCGRISLPTKWFDNDTVDEIAEFSFYYNPDNRELYSTEEWYTYWKICIHPLYKPRRRLNANKTPFNTIVSVYDFKSNPRRIHPYATIIVNFADKIHNFIRNHNEIPPYFVLPKIILPSSLLSNYRDELPEEYKYLWNKDRYCMHNFATKIQSCYRRFLAVRVAESIRMDPDSLFTADKSIIDIRLRKCGIDPATYHKMSAGRDI